MIKVDKSLEEVWEMKDKVYKDFRKSGYKYIIDFIKNDTKELELKYYIRNRTKE